MRVRPRDATMSLALTAYRFQRTDGRMEMLPDQSRPSHTSRTQNPLDRSEGHPDAAFSAPFSRLRVVRSTLGRLLPGRKMTSDKRASRLNLDSRSSVSRALILNKLLNKPGVVRSRARDSSLLRRDNYSRHAIIIRATATRARENIPNIPVRTGSRDARPLSNQIA